jgi:hypothetical protein
MTQDTSARNKNGPATFGATGPIPTNKPDYIKVWNGCKSAVAFYLNIPYLIATAVVKRQRRKASGELRHIGDDITAELERLSRGGPRE